MHNLNTALKEWHLLISALLAGEQAVLLRKGGIYEANNEFELEHPRFLLFPTFIHQNSAHVKPAFRSRIIPANVEPSTIELLGWAEALRVFEVPDRPRLDRLHDLHIWDPPLLDMRFAYRPEKPLYLVVVRAHRLPAPVAISNTLEYAGCKSWVPLAESIPLGQSTPALPDPALMALIDRIHTTFAR